MCGLGLNVFIYQLHKGSGHKGIRMYYTGKSPYLVKNCKKLHKLIKDHRMKTFKTLEILCSNKEP